MSAIGTLAAVANEIRESYTPQAGDDAMSYIGLEHVEQGTLHLCGVGDSSAVVSNKFRFQAGDILFGKMRPYFRKVVRPDFAGVCSTEISVIRPKIAEDGSFVFYFVANQSFVDAASTASKGDRPRAKWEQFSTFESYLPETSIVRQKIGSVLSAYDDLIDNNRKRIALLEKAARLLYEEWFVRLRFPGHEHTPVVDGVPEGWERKLLFDVAEPTYGFSFKSHLFNEDEVGTPVIRIRDVPSGISQTFTPEEAPTEKLIQNGDLLIGMDGEFHMNLWSGGPSFLNQRVVCIKSKEEVNDFLLLQALKAPIAYYQATITGTTVAHLGAKHLKEIHLLIPGSGLLQVVNNLFAPLKQQIITLVLRPVSNVGHMTYI